MNVNDYTEEIGNRLKQARLNADLTQQDVANTTGLSRKVILRAEQGKAQLETVVAYLLALGQEKQLDVFLPPSQISPVQLAKSQRNKRQRASGKRSSPPKDKSAW